MMCDTRTKRIRTTLTVFLSGVTSRHAKPHRQTGRQAYSQAYRQPHRQLYRQAYRQTDIQAGRMLRTSGELEAGIVSWASVYEVGAVRSKALQSRCSAKGVGGGGGTAGLLAWVLRALGCGCLSFEAIGWLIV